LVLEMHSKKIDFSLSKSNAFEILLIHCNE